MNASNLLATLKYAAAALPNGSVELATVLATIDEAEKDPETRAPITEADIKEWLSARNAELRELKGAPESIHVTVWERDWGDHEMVVMITSDGGTTESAPTFAEAKEKIVKSFVTPEQRAYKLREQAQELVAKAVAIEATLAPKPEIETS